MNRNLKFIKNKIPLFLLAIYSIAYVYYYIYYSFFDINIFNYVSLNDLIFLGINNTFIIIILTIIVNYTIIKLTNFIIKIRFKHLLRTKEILNIQGVFGWYKKIYKTKNFFKITLYISLFLLLISILLMYLVNPLYSLPISLLNLMLFLYNKETKTKKKKKFQYSFIVLVYGVLLAANFFSATNNSNNILNLKDDTHVSFCSESIYYSTKDTNFNYNGETSLYLFLYDYKNNVSFIFFKEDIKNFKKDNNSFMIKSRKLFKKK